MKKLSKTEAKKEVEEFFSDIKNKSPREIGKIKKLSRRYNLPLKDFKKTFCRNCISPYSGTEKIRIKKGIKTIKCSNCKKISRWKINSS